MSDKKDLIQKTLPSANCAGEVKLPTPQEKECLDAMRSIKERVRELKNHRRLLETSNTEENTNKILDLEEELAGLKAEWDRWEKKHKAAVRERMIYLGHEEP